MLLKVAIATSSPDKINGIKEAIFRAFHMKESEIEFYSKSIESGVSEQPFGDETYVGALNRVHGVKKEFPEMDLYISCEAGIENTLGHYFNVQVVCIFDTRSQKYLWGKSAGWQVPSEHIEMIRKSNLDSYLRGKGISRIEELLSPQYSRKAFVGTAVEMALASGKLLERNN